MARAADDDKVPGRRAEHLAPEPTGSGHVLAGAIDVAFPGGIARFTDRTGGVSDGPYQSLNLGPWTQDASIAVTTNQQLVERSVGDGMTLRIPRQVHEVRVAFHLDGEEEPPLDGVDAQVTDRRNLILGALTADCLPVALIAPWGVGIAHAGWRGLAGGILTQTTHAMLALPGAGKAREIVAVLGPCARVCCYEVGEEVHAAFAGHAGAHFTRPGQGPQKIDLPAIAVAELERAGAGDIVDTGGCTIDDERWFSHRRSGGVTGRQAGLVWRA